MYNRETYVAANGRRMIGSLAIATFFIFILILISAMVARAQSYEVLHSFNRQGDGIGPRGGLIQDADGNLYGTTASGKYGYGTMFKVDTKGGESILHSFTLRTGGGPWAGLIADSKGTFYGTTTFGGKGNGLGTVFSEDATGHFSVLHVFKGGEDGETPYPGLVRDTSGNLYGVTTFGGTNGGGILFKVTPAGKETILHSFPSSQQDGQEPMGGLVMDKEGNLYGTTTSGGFQFGTVFKIDSSGLETILYTFTGESDGEFPEATLIMDDAGTLYGTTSLGGSSSSGGCGTVFQLEKGGNFRTLHTFQGAPDGCHPLAGLVRDGDGNLFGTTRQGGLLNCESGCGTIFKVSKSGKETVLHRFAGGDGGWFPYAGLLSDSSGNLYGTTLGGGYYNKGTVFKLTP
jgi:uncharacterized repeat protein (TIGR03803 family)